MVSTAPDDERLPAWVTWQRRPFPDANLLLLRGREPAGYLPSLMTTKTPVRRAAGPIRDGPGEFSWPLDMQPFSCLK